ncbi:hypothetical protein K8R14_00245 [bacterium]|nr:hypothetical protein [bacterium]
MVEKEKYGATVETGEVTVMELLTRELLGIDIEHEQVSVEDQVELFLEDCEDEGVSPLEVLGYILLEGKGEMVEPLVIESCKEACKLSQETVQEDMEYSRELMNQIDDLKEVGDWGINSTTNKFIAICLEEGRSPIKVFGREFLKGGRPDSKDLVILNRILNNYNDWTPVEIEKLLQRRGAIGYNFWYIKDTSSFKA